MHQEGVRAASQRIARHLEGGSEKGLEVVACCGQSSHARDHDFQVLLRARGQPFGPGPEHLEALLTAEVEAAPCVRPDRDARHRLAAHVGDVPLLRLEVHHTGGRKRDRHGGD